MQAEGDSSRFSGISARKGGTSTAIEAHVDEANLYPQCGHGTVLPAQAYMWIAFPASFLETFEAFGLRRVEGKIWLRRPSGSSRLGSSRWFFGWYCDLRRSLGLGWDGEVVVRR
jgi:hypothetical protein